MKVSSTIAFFGLLAGSALYAQSPLEQMTAPAAAPVYSAPAPKAAAPAEEKVKANFDQLRGNAYGTAIQGNAAAAFTVGDYLAIPHLMFNQKLLYVEPTLQSGVAAFSLGGMSTFMALNGTTATFGFAQKGMGLSLDLGLNNTFRSSKPTTGTETSTSVSDVGQLYGLNFSAESAGYAVTGGLYYQSVGQATNADNGGGNERVEGNYQAGLNLGLMNFPSATDWYYGFGLNVERFDNTLEVTTVDDVTGASTTTTTVNTAAYLAFALSNVVGKQIAISDEARAFFGNTTTLGYAMFDEVEVNAGTPSGTKASSALALSFAPNLAGEYAISNSWYFTGGVTHQIQITMLGHENWVFASNPAAPATPAVAMKASDVSKTELMSQATTAATAVRYMYNSLSLEAGLSSTIYNQGPAAFFSGSNLLMNLGAMIQF